MKRMTFVPAALLICGATIQSASAAESIYRDPQGRFTLLIPADWTAAVTADGVRVSHGEAEVHVAVVEGGGTTAGLLSSLVEQAKAQQKNFSEISRGPCQVGGYDGACSVVSGVAPKGQEVLTRFAALVTGGRRYVLLAQVPPRHLPALRGDLVRIEESFAPAGSIYRDPQGRFTLRVPEDWTATTTKDGDVSITHGKVYADLMVFEGQVPTALSLLRHIVRNIEKQSKNLTEIEVSPCRFGGQAGRCGRYSGVDPRGIEVFFRVAAMAEGGQGYGLLMVVPQRDFSVLKVDLDGIEQSFALGRMPAR